MKKHIQTQTEWENEMGLKILEFIKSELYLNIPFLNIAFKSLFPVPHETIQSFATDGRYVYYSSEQLIRVFKTNSLFLDRSYLHVVLHCIFFHLWQRGNKNKELWSLACDICVEYTVDHFNKPCTKRILTLLRQNTYKEIELLSGVSASNIYVWLLGKDNKQRLALQREFYTDDHRFWPNEEQEKMAQHIENQNKWNKIARQTKLNSKKRNDESDGESVLIQQIKTQRNKRSYREFLKLFSINREELEINEDEFDLSYYTYGLKIYKNMPLIEPLESKETKKIREFVIVIDTSYSTNGILVENFLKETYTLLSESDSYFHKTKIHIIQCDNKVRTDNCIESKEQMESLLNSFTLVGGGGTDFRPAFEYVNELLKEGQLKEISGLLYFTDGKGIYPTRRPDYKTAFLFLDEYDETIIPPWAIRMKLDPCELLGEEHEH